MKKSKHLKKLKNEGELFQQIINSHCDKIKSDYAKILLKEKNDLISRIAEGEGLDELELRNKYLKNTNKTVKVKKEIITDESENILDKVIIKGLTYYYENKADGCVYNDKSIKVGFYKNNTFSFN